MKFKQNQRKTSFHCNKKDIGSKMRMYKTWTKKTVMRKQTKEEKKKPYCRDVMRCAVLFDFDGKWITPMKPCSRKDCLSKLWSSILRNYMCLVLCSLRLFIYYNDKNRNGCIRCIQVQQKKGNQWLNLPISK